MKVSNVNWYYLSDTQVWRSSTGDVIHSAFPCNRTRRSRRKNDRLVVKMYGQGMRTPWVDFSAFHRLYDDAIVIACSATLENNVLRWAGSHPTYLGSITIRIRRR